MSDWTESEKERLIGSVRRIGSELDSLYWILVVIAFGVCSGHAFK